jgi:hypothetical protein
MTRAKKIKTIMELLNLSNRDMAKFLNVTEQALHYILCEKVTTIKDSMIDRLGELSPQIIKYLFDLDGTKHPFNTEYYYQETEKARKFIRKATK